MSQIYKSSASGPTPPSVATQYNTDIDSPAVPAANQLNVFGGSVTTNNAHGIQTDGSSGSNTLTVELTNRATGAASTSGTGSANLISLPLGSTPGVYTFDIAVAGFATVGLGAPAGCGFTIVGSARTDGAIATIVPNQAVDHFEEAPLIGVEASLTASSNSAIVLVTGVSGFDIDWNGTLNYTFVS